MRAGFAYFVSFLQAARDFSELARTRLTMPVLTIGGRKSLGEFLARQIPLVGTDVRSVVLENAGHWVTEEDPKGTTDALASFLTGAEAEARPAAKPPADTSKRVFSEALPNVPGQTLTAVVVDYAPGAKSERHRHAGSVFVYVLSGAIRSECSATGPARVYKAGETFFEPPGSIHLVSENASDTEPASLLAVFVAENGARLSTPDEAPRD
jgi:quercetin dioxygenase-like cupin family protein